MSQLNLNTNYIDFDSGRNQILVNGPAEISTDGKYEIIKFTGDGTFQITKAAREVEYLIVGGGGAGGAANKYFPGGAGGGGGQVVSGSFNSVANYQYQVKVGAGGTSVPLNINLFEASGGIENTYVSGGVTYKVHVFTNTGSHTFTVNAGYTRAEILVVGAGGGGASGGDLGIGGEGGGAGAVLYSGSYDLQVASGSAGTYTVQVGSGGASNQAGQSSSFFPNFSYVSGYTTKAYGGGAGSGSGASGGGDGFAIYGTSSFSASIAVLGGQGQNGGQRLIYSGSGLGAATMSYYEAPGGGGFVQTGSRFEPRTATNWRIRIGESPTSNPNIYNISRISWEGVRSNVNSYNDPNCFNLGQTITSGSIINIDLVNPDSLADLVFGFPDPSKVYITPIYVDYLNSGSWINYLSGNASNATAISPAGFYTSSACGDFRLAEKIYNLNADGGGRGGPGIAYNLVNGTASYYGGGGGGGVFEGFLGYTEGMASGSYGGIGGGGKGAGYYISGSITGSLIGGTGSVNTGGGGGGGFASPTVGNRTAGGAGGSGIVAIRYVISGSENVFCASGSNGQNSSIIGYNLTASAFTFTALGGGGGGGQLSSSYNPTPFFGANGQNGGSGGGAGLGKSDDGTTVLTGSAGITLGVYGNNGAAAVAGTLSSGGGGGANAAGSGKNGGAGYPVYISGSGAYVGAGGAAYGGTGGLGSGSFGSGGSGNGGQGAAGVVIVRFSTSNTDNLY